jgi:GNAT superfamily N-acetyltransferase
VARQRWSADALAEDGGSIDVRELNDEEIARVDAALPLHRLDVAQTYLVAWDGDEPVGHAHIAWTRTTLGIPEIQDVFVLSKHRRRGIASALNQAAEQLAAERGHDRISLSYGVDNQAARSVYEHLGYADAGIPPQRMQETITIRGKPVEIDDTLIYLVKDL